MGRLKIIHFGHPTLRKKAKEIRKPDSPIVALAHDMVATLYDEKGVGLAAPQVDASVSLIVFDLSTEEARFGPQVLANPRIVEASDSVWEYEEGCLSVPEIRQVVKRPVWVTVEGMDLEGKPVAIEKAQGLFGRVLQHEIDHLNGKFFVDRLDEEQKAKIKAGLKKIEKATRRSLKK